MDESRIHDGYITSFHAQIATTTPMNTEVMIDSKLRRMHGVVIRNIPSHDSFPSVAQTQTHALNGPINTHKKTTQDTHKQQSTPLRAALDTPANKGIDALNTT